MPLSLSPRTVDALVAHFEAANNITMARAVSAWRADPSPQNKARVHDLWADDTIPYSAVRKPAERVSWGDAA